MHFQLLYTPLLSLHETPQSSPISLATEKLPVFVSLNSSPVNKDVFLVVLSFDKSIIIPDIKPLTMIKTWIANTDTDLLVHLAPDLGSGGISG